MKIRDLNIGDTIQIPNGNIPLEGKVEVITEDTALVAFPSVGHKYITESTTFIRIRKARKTLDPTKWIEKSIQDSQEYIDKVNKQSNDLQQRKRNDTVNHPSHYMLGNLEVKDIVALVADKYDKGSVAHNVASAIEYEMRAPEKNGLEDIKKARKCLDFAIENWDN